MVYGWWDWTVADQEQLGQSGTEGEWLQMRLLLELCLGPDKPGMNKRYAFEIDA